MEKSEKFSIPISHRDFMKLAAISATAIVAGGENPAKAAAATPFVKFDDSNIPVIFDTDVCVVGGGAAGTASAVTAARKGAKVVLVERGISLGGLATQGCVYPCMPTFIDGSDTPYIKDLNRRMEK